MMDLSVVPYEAAKPEAVRAPGGDVTAARYRECMRNHAASIGGQAFDGCGEFMPSGDSLLKCAACGCHRNFHRRDGLFAGVRHPLLLPPPPYFPPPAAFRMPPPQAAIAPSAVMERGRLGSETPPRADGGEGSRKRIRTKFTAEQKEKMQAFAEKLGWRIQKHDDVALEEFCVEIGVKRHVLKVWMHNNKSHLSSSSTSAAAAAGGNANGGSKTEPAAISV